MACAIFAITDFSIALLKARGLGCFVFQPCKGYGSRLCSPCGADKSCSAFGVFPLLLGCFVSMLDPILAPSQLVLCLLLHPAPAQHCPAQGRMNRRRISPKRVPWHNGGDRDGTGAVNRTGGFRGLTATPHRCCLNPGLSSCWVYPWHPPAVLRFGAPGVFPWTFMLGQFLVLFIFPFFFFLTF